MPQFSPRTWPPIPIEQIQLMGAVAEAFSLTDSSLVYEPKYDGIRVKVEMLSGTLFNGVRMWSRQDNLVTAQFPDVVRALDRLRSTLPHPLLTDGEIVATDSNGRPLNFEDLQPRLGVLRPTERSVVAVPVALILFDILLENSDDLRSRPLLERRARLEQLVHRYETSTVRVSRLVQKDGRAMLDEAKREGWEGLIAKRADSRYRSGKFHRNWLKYKLLLRQEFVVGGWTESERRPFRALLIGVYRDDGTLQYVGRMGKAFTDAELKRLTSRLHALEISRCPFTNQPDPDATPHWVKPQLVIEAKFTEWTKGGKLREPTYLGARTDVDPTKVKREPVSSIASARRSVKAAPNANELRSISALRQSTDITDLLRQVDDLEYSAAHGVLTFGDGGTLVVDNLHKHLWRTLGITKAELMRYYIRLSPFLLPPIADRPLTYRPFPHGVDRRPDRYHQRVLHAVPQGVRVESFKGAEKDYEPRFIGGSLITLLYMVQHHVISQDAWLSTVHAPDYPDLAVLDLDPMPDVPFQQVVDVARWLHDELEALDVPHFLKTSGSSGLHIYLPLAHETSFRQSEEFCELLARLVAQKHPRQATVERIVRSRGKRVYLDYLQNLPGKTVATAYSIRANAFAGISAPLKWEELTSVLGPDDFTIRTIEHRLQSTGDLWAALRETRRIDLNA